MMVYISGCKGFLLCNVFFQIHRPFVQELIVGPTWNPPFLVCKRTLLTKKLLPVLYLPTMLMAAIFFSSGMERRNY